MKLAESLPEATPDVVTALAAKVFCLLTICCCFAAAFVARSVTRNAFIFFQSACAALMLLLLPFLQSKKHDCHHTRVGLFDDGHATSKVMKLLSRHTKQLSYQKKQTNKFETPAQNPELAGKAPTKHELCPCGMMTSAN